MTDDGWMITGEDAGRPALCRHGVDGLTGVGPDRVADAEQGADVAVTNDCDGREAAGSEGIGLAAEVVAAPPGDVAHIIALQDSTSHRVDQRAAALLREVVWPSLSAEQRAAMPLPFVQAVESGFPFRRGRVFF